MKKLFFYIIILLFTSSCYEPTSKETRELKNIDSTQEEYENPAPADTFVSYSSIPEEEAIQESKPIKETRLRYPDFTVVFHDFSGYKILESEKDQRRYY